MKIYDMVEYISEHWDEAGVAEIGMSKREAATFLGHPTKDMSREEIDEEVSQMQLAYYTESGMASDEEIKEKYNEIRRILS